MNIIMVSDLHMDLETPAGRLDDTGETAFRKLEYVLQEAAKRKAIILQAGDFMNKPRSWFLLPRLIDLLKRYGIPIYCVAGQHDVYMYNEETKDNTSLGVLAKAGLVTILGEKGTIHGNVVFYGASYGQEIPFPNYTKEKGIRDLNILVVHAPIAEEWVGGDFIEADKFLKEHTEYDYILCGDIHRRFQVNSGARSILNTGPLVRREATTYNFAHRPYMVYLKIEGKIRVLNWIEIPHEPAGKVLTRDHIEREEDKNQMLAEFIERIESGSGNSDHVSFDQVLQDLLKETKADKKVRAILSEVMGNGSE
jgi:DNA repair protein SbcD/Mre11